jgi:hypothetical protein
LVPTSSTPVQLELGPPFKKIRFGEPIPDVQQPLRIDTRVSIVVKSKRVPPIFNEESTGSFICLRLDIYMSHVLLLPQSGIDHDFVSVVKILLKASFHSFLQNNCYTTRYARA